MKKVIEFLKSEGFLCMLITFLVCSFLETWTGLAVAVVMLISNIIYIKKIDLYNLIGFGTGWALSAFHYWIY